VKAAELCGASDLRRYLRRLKDHLYDKAKTSIARMDEMTFNLQRERLVENELRLLGIRNEAVLKAMREVPREAFVSEELREFAYRNAPLPIGSGQTISQPLIVAHMAEALELGPNDRVLEIGAGSGYAAAILSWIAKEVFTVERHRELAASATERLRRLGYRNVHVLVGDGTRGWPDEAPFDAIVVAAGSPGIPPALLEQLGIGGRLVIPVGESKDSQQLIRVVRRGKDKYEHEELGGVRFVPLIGEAGWQPEEEIQQPTIPSRVSRGRTSLPDLIRGVAEPFSSIDSANLQPLLERIGNARLVLIGEASHGTSEFYRVRAEITKALIERQHFDFVAIEADWPDAYRIHDFVTHKERKEPHDWEAFARFPTWMWRNQEVLDFVHWLRDFNLQRRSRTRRVGFYGLDLYSMFTSVDCVLKYLDRVDPKAAAVARIRYGCLTPWDADPADYGRAALTGQYRSCEVEVVRMLQDLSKRRVAAAVKDGDDLFDAQLNARLIANAEEYYRIMYYGSDESWNHRDTHMFETLRLLLDRYGNGAKAVIWEHNSHLGNAAATQFGKHGQINVGQLCRETFGDDVYAIGQGTDRGTVAAATDWEGAMEIKHVRPAHPDSYERLMHLAEMSAFFLPLTKSRNQQLTEALADPRLERAIGVIYHPETERLSHYFDASLPQQFDEWIWFDETEAVHSLTTQQSAEHEPPHPFAKIDR
jgi:protein-L-isoaspartate(D-aspartate) O-methyltransferase